MAQYSEEGDFAAGYGALHSRSPDNFEAAFQDSSGRAAFNALLINQAADLPSEYVASIPEHFVVPQDHHAQMMQGGFHADILSATKYPDLLAGSESIPRRSERRHTQPERTQANPFGGYTVLEDVELGDEPMARDNPNTEKPARKRTKKNSKSDDDDSLKKQRGRPRLDTRDETAADRRRTQIRLAQRAYRQRKETTISALKKRVKELEGTIDEMNKSFLKFNDNAISSGLLRTKPELAQQLRGTTEHFLNLAKTATPDSDHDEEILEELARESSPSTSSRHASFSNGRQQKHDARLDQPLGYEVSYEERGDNSNSPPRDASPEHDMMQSSDQDWRVMNTYQQYNVQIPEIHNFPDPATLPIERPLKPSSPYTYSFQETTFARRLHRACLERAFRLLTNPAANQEQMSRAFRFTFCFSNKKRMLLRFQELLKRSAGESLENWNVPFFRVGGAGTHYPRVDEQGRPMYPPNMHSPAKAFGPAPFVVVETPRDEESVGKMLEAIGFDGEWFDSHDVEQYLRELGIRLDGHSTFVDVDPGNEQLMRHIPSPLLQSLSFNTITAGGGGRAGSDASSDSLESPLRTPPPPHSSSSSLSSAAAGAGRNSGFVQQLSSEDYTTDGPFNLTTDPTFASDGFFPFQEKMLDFDDSHTQELAMPDYNDPAQQHKSSSASAQGFPERNINFSINLQTSTTSGATSRMEPLTVDVQRLLDKMVDRSVCLGRAPGFRRDDIDNAISMALQEAF